MNAIVFGSDQGLVGQFNDLLADFVVKTLDDLPGDKKVWAVGERVQSRLADAGLPPVGLFSVPTSVNAITPLVGQILVESEMHHKKHETVQLYLFHNRPKAGAAYDPVSQHLLPLDAQWELRLAHLPWPTKNLPEVIGGHEQTLRALVREYLFVSLYKACASRWQPKTRAAWPPCNEPRKTSTTSWEPSIRRSAVCARLPSMRNCSTSYPATNRSPRRRRAEVRNDVKTVSH